MTAAQAKGRKVHPLWWAALAGTVLWIVLGGSADDADGGTEVAEPSRPARTAEAAAPRRAAAPTAASASLAAGVVWQRAPLDPASGRGVMDKAWEPPPPPPPPPPKAQRLAEAPPPPAPAPPPVPAGPPLQLLGVVKTDTPTPQVFFSLADRLIQAKAGEVIDGRFRIEAITASKIIVTVLPDGQRLEIPITTAAPGG